MAGNKPSDATGDPAQTPVGVQTPFPLPTHCATGNIAIDAKGQWYHEGSPIGRVALAKLFASVLHRDLQGYHWLITPAEMSLVQVERTAYLIVGYHRASHDDTGMNSGEAGTFVFETTLGEHFTPIFHAGACRMEFVGETAPASDAHYPASNKGNTIPAFVVRHRALAALSRSVYYDLIEIALSAEPPQVTDAGIPYVVSEGHRIMLAPSLPPTPVIPVSG